MGSQVGGRASPEDASSAAHETNEGAMSWLVPDQYHVYARADFSR